jgi:hypothetical protein
MQMDKLTDTVGRPVGKLGCVSKSTQLCSRIVMAATCVRRLLTRLWEAEIV